MVINGQTTVESAEIIATPIPISLIDPAKLNRRSDDADADIAELARTIAENGLIHPISARPRDGGRYEIICGERRWRAFRLLERETIPCVVKDLDDTQAQIERIIENYQRRDPSFMEQGEAVAALMELTDRDVSEVANRLGQSVSWVRRRSKLPSLIPAWRDELAKENTPYFAIRDSVNKLEEISVLPPATQQTILDTNVLRYVKTTKEMRNTIAKLFMNLDAKPWTRTWEKKAFTGYDKKRCDACMKRSDRESALFANPDDPGKGKSMCLDPECWKTKCLSWSRSLIADNPGMVPIRQNYCYRDDGLEEFFGVEPVTYYNWQKQEEADGEREGRIAAVGVFVDGPEIGTTATVWLEQEDEDDEADDDDTSIQEWRRENARKQQMRQELTEIIAADVYSYLAEVDVNATMPSVVLADRKLRAAAWFGVFGYVNSEEEGIPLDDSEWNPLEYVWEQAAEHIAGHVAATAAADVVQLFNGDQDHDADSEITTKLAAMFEIPLDMIATRAAEKQHKMGEDAEDGADPEMESDPEPDVAAPITDVEALTEPNDFIQVESVPFYPALAEAQ